MMHQFPTGFEINGTRNVPENTLQVKLSGIGKRVEFTKEPDAGFTISIINLNSQTTHIIGKDCSVAVCKEILIYLTSPQKELTNKTLKQTIRKLIPKRKRCNKRTKHKDLNL